MNNQEMGIMGENIACQYLESKGYQILERNFECRQGEIDIIALDHQELVFIEVKTRCNYQYGEARNAVNHVKQKHIYQATSYYIYKRNLEKELIRFDVIEVYVLNKIKVNHLKNVEFKI